MFKKLLIMLAVVMLLVTSVLSFVACGVSVKMPTDERLDDDVEIWDTVFFDDFKGDKLDKSKWRINTFEGNNNARRGGFYTDEPDNIFVKDDSLTIRTNYKTSQYGTGWHTSWVETAKANGYTEDGYEGFNSVGGYFEIKSKSPKTIGIWSAFWLMPDGGSVAFSDKDEQWTAKDGAEIDIMESFGYTYGKSYTQHVVHADGYDIRQKSHKSDNFEIDDMYGKFHTYAMEWTAEKYIFYIDGYKTWESTHKFMGKSLGVSEVLQYMILSVEISSKGDEFWAGVVDKNDKAQSYDFVIDYVKVMKRK